MKKKSFILIVVSLMACLVGSIAVAGGPSGPAGKSNVGHLYLCQKDPALLSCVPGYPPCNEQSVECLEGAGWGKMKYNLEGQIFEFDFEGHRLIEGQSYTLIYYPDNPFGGLIYLGSDTATGPKKDGELNGNVHIQGSLFTGNLPASYDPNLCNVEDCPSNLYGAKIWLVPSSDVCIKSPSYPTNLVGGYEVNIEYYLFETSLITFTSTAGITVCGEE